MEQAALYDCIRRAGAEVLVFEDHPGFFGNWRAHIQTRKDRLEVVCDHREGWITLTSRPASCSARTSAAS